MTGHRPFDELSRSVLARPGAAERIRRESEPSLIHDEPAAVEFTVHVDSRAGVADDEVLTRFAEEMEDSAALGPACGMTGDGALSVTFQVETTSPQQAAGIVALVFTHAMREAGIAEPLIEVDRVDAYRGLAPRMMEQRERNPCIECGRDQRADERGLQAYLAVDDDVAVCCPACARCIRRSRGNLWETVPRGSSGRPLRKPRRQKRPRGVRLAPSAPPAPSARKCQL